MLVVVLDLEEFAFVVNIEEERVFDEVKELYFLDVEVELIVGTEVLHYLFVFEELARDLLGNKIGLVY